MDPHVEAQLVQKAQQGCRDALDRLLVEHQGRLEALIDLRMGPRLRAKVEPWDIRQDTWMRAWASIKRFQHQGDDSFFRWLARISERVILDRHRYYFETLRQLENQSLDQKLSSPDSKAPQSWLRDEGAVTPSDRVRRGERFDRLRAAFDLLDDDYRQVLLLVRAHRMPIAEVAEHMERSEGAVEMLLMRAARQLKKIFGETASVHLPEGSLGGLEPPHAQPA